MEGKMLKLKSFSITMFLIVFILSTQTIFADVTTSNVNQNIGNGWRITEESLKESDYNLNPYNNAKGYRVVSKEINGSTVYNVASPDGKIILPQDQNFIFRIDVLESEIHVFPNSVLKSNGYRSQTPGIIVYDLNGNELTKTDIFTWAEELKYGWRKAGVGEADYIFVDSNWKKASWWTNGMRAPDNFSEGFLAVQTPKQSFFIDASGNRLFEDRNYYVTENFEGGCARVGFKAIGVTGEVIERLGLIDKNGKQLLPIRYDYYSLKYDNEKNVFTTIEAYKDPNFSYTGNDKFEGDKTYVDEMKNYRDLISNLGSHITADGYCPYKKYWRYENGILKDVTDLYNKPPKGPDPFIPGEKNDFSVNDIKIEKMDNEFIIKFKVYDNKQKKVITDKSIHYQIDYIANDNKDWLYTTEWEKESDTPKNINCGGAMPDPDGTCYKHADLGVLSPGVDIKNLQVRIRIWNEIKTETGYDQYFSNWSEIAKYTYTPKNNDNRLDAEGFKLEPVYTNEFSTSIYTPAAPGDCFLSIRIKNKPSNASYDDSVSKLKDILLQKLDKQTVDRILTYMSTKNNDKTSLDLKDFVSNGYCIDVQADTTPWIILEFFKGDYGNIIPVDKTQKEALPMSSTIIIDGTVVPFTAYGINGNNYFKLRDLAMALRKSSKKFNVYWDQSKQVISVAIGQEYKIAGGELEVLPSMSKQTATQTTASIRLSGLYRGFVAYGINGNNYFKLRDIAKRLNFYVGWDGKANKITIDTSKSYEN